MKAIRVSLFAVVWAVAFVGCGGAPEPDPTPAPEPEVRVEYRTPAIDYDRIADEMESRLDAELNQHTSANIPLESTPAPVVVESRPPAREPEPRRAIDNDALKSLRMVVAEMGDGFYRGDIDAIAAAYRDLRVLLAHLQETAR